MSHFRQHTIDARAHRNRIFPRLNVQIARAKLNRILNQAVDQNRHLQVLGGHFGFQILDGITHKKGVT